MITPVGATVVAVTLVFAIGCLQWLIKSYRRLRLFEELGIPGPKPQFFWGNMKQMTKNRIEVLMEWKTKYGKTFGVYQGHEPFLVITDPDMVYECFVKQAAIFRDRPNTLIDAEPFRSSLFKINGEEWKFVRGFLKCAFTSNQIRQLSTQANVCTARFVKSVVKASEVDGSVDVTYFAMAYAVDFLTNTLLTWDMNCQGNRHNEVLECLIELSKELDGAAIEVAFTMPIIRYILSRLYPFTEHAKRFNKLIERVRNIVHSRRSGKNNTERDVAQAIIDALQEASNPPSTLGCKHRNIFHDQHIFSNIVIFMFAGFDGMSASLSFLLYLLAKHPLEQGAIIREANERFPHKEAQELGFDEVRQLKRLDMVTKEGLRLYPPVPVTLVRQCAEDTTVCGQFVPAGMAVAACPWLIHHDAHIWPNPELFLPERFADSSTESKKGAFLPLGLGPRKCIGEELGLLAVKSALLKLLQCCTLTLKDENARPVRALSRALTLVPESGIYITVHPKTREADVGLKVN